MSRDPSWIWSAIEIRLSASAQEKLGTTAIRLPKRVSSTGIPITFIITQDLIFETSGEIAIPANTPVEGTYRGCAQEYDNFDIRIHASDLLIEIDPNHLVIETVAAKLCFRCGIHDLPELFKRDGRKRDKSPILSEICEGCHRKLISKVQDYDGKARKNGGKALLTVSQWLEKLKASQGFCHYCKDHVGFHELIMEHMKPLSWGGDNSIENVAPACIGCNSSKGSRDIKTWRRDTEASQLLELLQRHLGLGRFETINQAIFALAEKEGISIQNCRKVEA